MVYTNLPAVEAQKMHGMFESSRLESTDVGRIYDALVVDNMSNKNPIDVDNGVPIKMQAFTGNGLQERYATIADTTDMIAVVGAPAIVKDAFTTAQKQPYNFYIPAGTDAKSYQVKSDYEDIFAVASYQFTNEANVKKDAYVVTDGKGMWTALETEPTGYGFVGQIHSIAVGTYYTMVRILTLKNENVTQNTVEGGDGE